MGYSVGSAGSEADVHGAVGAGEALVSTMASEPLGVGVGGSSTSVSSKCVSDCGSILAPVAIALDDVVVPPSYCGPIEALCDDALFGKRMGHYFEWSVCVWRPIRAPQVWLGRGRGWLSMRFVVYRLVRAWLVGFLLCWLVF